MKELKLIGILVSMLLITIISVIVIEGKQTDTAKKANQPDKVTPNHPQVSAEMGKEAEMKASDEFTVVLDPGHGGNDGGATGVNGTKEKEITLQTTEQIQQLLKKHGVNVVSTRTGDKYVELSDRVQMAKELEADLFISIHYDGFETADVNGMTSYYYHEEDAAIARAFHTLMTAKEPAIKDRGVLEGNYYVLRENAVPSILLELGYITNTTDEARMNTEEFRQKVAESIAEVAVDLKEAAEGTTPTDKDSLSN